MVAKEVLKQCTSSNSNDMNSLDSQPNVNHSVCDDNNEVFTMEELGQVKEESQGAHTMDKDFDKDLSMQPPISSLDVVESVSNNHLTTVNNDGRGFFVGHNEELGTDKNGGSLKLEDQCNNKDSSIRVVYSSLPSQSKRKLEELLHQWSEWHTRYGMSSKDPAECLESGEETYFPALRVGSENSLAVSFSMDVHVRKRQRIDSLPLNNDCSSLYERGYAVGLASDGVTLESTVDMREAPRCFNCGSYNHPLGDCQKPRDNAAVSKSRKQFLNKKNQNGRASAQTRYYQESPGGKFDGLKPGSLSEETRKLMGLGELDPPPWLNRMRELGYPLGYLDSEEDMPSGIEIFGGEESKDVDTINDHLLLDAKTPQKKMTVKFPGINAPIPENADQKKWVTPVAPIPNVSWHQSNINRWNYSWDSLNNGFVRGVQYSPTGLGLSPPTPPYAHYYHPREHFGPRGVPPGSPRYGSPADARSPFMHHHYEHTPGSPRYGSPADARSPFMHHHYVQHASNNRFGSSSRAKFRRTVYIRGRRRNGVFLNFTAEIKRGLHIVRFLISQMDLVFNDNDRSNCILRQCSTLKRKDPFDSGSFGCQGSVNKGKLPNKRLCQEKPECKQQCSCTNCSSSRFGHVLHVVGKEPTLSKGEQVKKLCNVVQMRVQSRKRQPNIVCRVEAFGRVVEHFDDRRRRWVVEMGFGGLLNMVGLSLPRTLCYWLMTRVDPIKETILLNDGLEYALQENQVRWVLGLPLGPKVIPRKTVDEKMRMKEESILAKYGMERHALIKGTGKEIHSKGVTVSESLLERLKDDWSEEDEEEFKVCFLMLALYMVLCPTQSPCLESDLIPAVTLAPIAQEYNWCSLVLEKMMCSVSRFSKKFDADGYAGGCGGCSIFVALYYLDRLDRKPVQWDIWPRIKAWTAEELRKGCREDRLCEGGDFGKLKCVPAAYGEPHPFDSGDKCPPTSDSVD